MTNVRLEEHLTYKKIFRVAIVPVLLMILASIYGIVDGFCVSTFKGADAFAGVNLAMPIISIVGTVGYIFSTGGSALIGKMLGEGRKEKANKTFTTTLIVSLIIGVVVSAIVAILFDNIIYAFASVSASPCSQEMLDQAITYGRIICFGAPLYILQCVFCQFLYLDEKPKISFIFSFAAGVTNMIFDFVFVGACNLGVVGAASATIMGYSIASIGPLLYFIFSKNNRISFAKPKFVWKDFGKICFNGLSEFTTNISICIVSLLLNYQLLKYYGQDGVSANGALMYLGFIFVAIFIGYIQGVSPFISYNYGNNNNEEIANILRKSLIFIGISGIIMVGLSEALAYPVSFIFSSGSESLRALIEHATRIYCIVFLFNGFNIFGSGFFTALNNGLISAILSLTRCLILETIFIIVLPLFMGKEGLWLASPIVDLISMIMFFIFLFVYNKRYHYFIKKDKSPND